MLSVVSLMKEQFEDIAHFIEYHLGLGIDDILIFYDGNDVEALRSNLKERLNCGGYTVFAVDEISGIQAYLGPPKVFEGIQNTVHQIACEVARNPWIITLDADEFLFGSGLTAKFLSSVPEQILSVRFPVAEAVWLPCDDPWCAFGSTGFRTPLRFRSGKRITRVLRKLIPRVVYRKDKNLFTDNVTGHGQGRHIFRRSVEFDYIGPHHAEIGGNDVSILVNELQSPPGRTEILHFDAISFDRWREKISRRVSREIVSQNVRLDRRIMFEKFLACDAATDAATIQNQKKLFQKLYCLTWLQYFVLRIFSSSFRADPFGYRMK